MAKYSKSAGKTVKSAMSRMKEGKLKSGSGAKVKNPKQAIAIGLSEAREKGAKVPWKKSAKKKPGRVGKPAAKKAPGKKAAARKSVAKKSAGRPRKSAPKKAARKR